MNRYPGIRPFNKNEQHLFFGRTDDVERLYRLMRLEQIVVLYGKSGYGKSSLLAAGIYPKLEKEERYQYWEVRFGPYREGVSATPADAVCAAVQQGLPPLQSPAASIWQALKNRQTPEKYRFILFFDQCEELFNYPPAQIAEFKQQLAEALYAPIPQYVAAVAKGLDQEAEDLLYRPFEMKVVWSIREDRMALLKQLEDYLPNPLRHGIRLEALNEQQAMDAVTIPSSLLHPPDGSEPFDTLPFSYAPETLQTIIEELRDKNGRIDTAVLQIVCKHVEHNIVSSRALPTSDAPASPGITVTKDNLGNLKSVFRAFYDQTIEALDVPLRPIARSLVEDLLIKDDARMPFAEQVLLAQPGVTISLLEKLEKSSLLRVELDGQRRKIYEIGHDTLVAPITEAADTRRLEEEKQRLEAAAEAQREEMKRVIKTRRRARMAAIGATALALFAIAAWAYAFWQEKELRNTTRQVVEGILDNATAMIGRLQYDEAWGKISDACKLSEANAKSARSLMEIAYFYNETGQRAQTIAAIGQAAAMFGKEGLALALDTTNTGEGLRKAVREALRNLDPARFAELEARYYPVMIPIPGGTFMMGCDTNRIIDWDADELPRHLVQLSDFELAQTETTFWQYGLYASATGINISSLSPGWGIDGDNPVVNVSWLDACRYANWLSKRFDKDTAYLFSNNTVRLNPNAPGAFQLPTEAEWEYAAGGGDKQEGTLYAGSDSLDNVAWHHKNAQVKGNKRSHTVKMKQPNRLQLYDMTGNVWEWCWDWYGPYPGAETTPVLNPAGPATGTYKVLRGSSFYEFTYFHLSNRLCDRPDNLYPDRGFRLRRGF